MRQAIDLGLEGLHLGLDFIALNDVALTQLIDAKEDLLELVV